MPYSIFLSCADEDKPIASNIKLFLESIFGSEIDVYFYGHVGYRNRWQDEIRKRLIKSDALITLLTPIYRYKPWIFIEFTPFWINNKDIFILSIEDNIHKDSELPLLQHYNLYQMKDNSDLERFLKTIEKSINSSKKINDISNKKNINIFKELVGDGIIQADLHKSNQQHYTELLAIRQFEAGDSEGFLETIEVIEDDLIKKNIAYHTFFNKNNTLTIDVLKTIYEAKYIRQFVQMILRRNLYTKEFLEKLYEILEVEFQECRNLARYIIDIDKWDSYFFYDLIERITNNAELRNVAKYFITKVGYIEDVFKITRNINNDAEIKNLLIFNIKRNQHRNDLFIKLFSTIKNEKHRRIVIEELERNDIDYFKKNIKDFE